MSGCINMKKLLIAIFAIFPMMVYAEVINMIGVSAQDFSNRFNTLNIIESKHGKLQSVRLSNSNGTQTVMLKPNISLATTKIYDGDFLKKVVLTCKNMSNQTQFSICSKSLVTTILSIDPEIDIDAFDFQDSGEYEEAEIFYRWNIDRKAKILTLTVQPKDDVIQHQPNKDLTDTLEVLPCSKHC